MKLNFLFIISSVLFLSGCSQPIPVDDLLHESLPNNTTNVFTSAPSAMRYMGSDDEYDYYRLNGFCSLLDEHYKVPTEVKRFYPHTMPYRGWLGEAFLFTHYRGRIIITSHSEWKKLQKHYRKTIHPALLKELSRFSETIKPSTFEKESKIRQAFAGKLCLKMLNEWTIKHWGQDRLNIPSIEGIKYNIDWMLIPAHSSEEEIARLREPDKLHTIPAFWDWVEDVRFGW